MPKFSYNSIFLNCKIFSMKLILFNIKILKKLTVTFSHHIAANLPFETFVGGVWTETVIVKDCIRDTFFDVITHFAAIYKKNYKLMKNIKIYFNKWSTINCYVVQCKKSTCGWQISVEICDTLKSLQRNFIIQI